MKKVICFGEVLWDCLPVGEFPGGAPLNIAYHLTRLGCRATLLSAVGRDDRGARLLAWMRDKGIDIRRIQFDPEWPTGTLTVTVDEQGGGTYEIDQPVAWDRIPVTDDTVHLTTASAALVYGTLASRTQENRDALKFLVALWEPMKVFDVNLRPPFDDVAVALELARRSDVIKLNVDELYQLSDLHPDDPDDSDEVTIFPAAERLKEMSGCESICITKKEAGVLFLHHGQWYSAQPPAVKLHDPLGAGDAFTAALTRFLLAEPKPEEIAGGLAACCALAAFVASSDGAQPEYDPVKVIGEVRWIGKNG